MNITKFLRAPILKNEHLRTAASRKDAKQMTSVTYHGRKPLFSLAFPLKQQHPVILRKVTSENFQKITWKHLWWSLRWLWAAITDVFRRLSNNHWQFFRKVSPEMFDRVLNTPLSIILLLLCFIYQDGPLA